ncbi:MAG: asparaginase [Candidatus Caenarcaniphilales bacterium]|nr:asparaginase [Candidatus Caenarcaniphilales bacterium]
MTVLLAQSRRGQAIEENWYGDWAIWREEAVQRAEVEGAGEGREGGGHFDCSDQNFLNTYIGLRSVAKLFQTYACLGLISRQLSLREIAICTSSHSGTTEQLKLLADFLDKHKLNWQDLDCAEHRPLDQEISYALPGSKERRLQNNCSGKHALMMLACQDQSWDLKTYRRSDHPLQRRIGEEIAQLARLDKKDILIANDGCGVPAFALPVKAVLRALKYFRVDGENPLCAKIAQALLEYPELVSGETRLDHLLTKAYRKNLISKSGAGGLVVIIIQSKKPAVLLLKLSSSMSRTELICEALLRRLDIDPHMPFSNQIHNLHHEVVGQIDCLIPI